MNTADRVQRMRPILGDRLARPETELHAASDNARTVTLDPGSVGRLSRMDAMQQQAMALATVQRLQRQRRRLDAALQRVQQQTCGSCCACAEPIGLEPLLPDPAAPLCMDCQLDRDAQRDAAR